MKKETREPENRRGREPERKYDDRKHGPKGHSDKKKKKKRRHHTLLWAILIALLLGILIGLVLDWGVVGNGTGKGWIGNTIGNITGTGSGQDEKKEPVDLTKDITPALTPVATQAPVATAADVYIKIKESKLYMNEVEISAENIIAQLGTATYKGATVHLIDEYATKAVYDNLKTYLNNNGITNIVEE